MASDTPPEQSYCADQARRGDWDRFMCALFAPAEAREYIYALIAFNCELARTRDVVSQPLLGQIRLQWWRDAIADLYGDGAYDPSNARHPILAPMATGIARYALPRTEIDAMIDARSDELDGDFWSGESALVAYLRATSANLGRLQARILAPERAHDDGLLAVVDHASMALGAMELRRAGIRSAEAEAVARSGIEAARRGRAWLDPRHLPVMLQASLAETYLRSPRSGRIRRQAVLAMKAFRKTY